MSLIVPIWYLVLAGILPQISEAIYSPALPSVALDLHTTATMMQYTLSIFLLGFGAGVLFWGRLSDFIGRKPALLWGMILFAIASLVCYLATNIETLLLCRFFQAFGGATGSVIGQAICRDAFDGAMKGRVFASISAAMSLSPALGPIIGGLTVDYVGWRVIFLFFVVGGLATSLLGLKHLPETHGEQSRMAPKPKVSAILHRMIKDPKVLVFGGLVGGLNGIGFAYYGEGPFYLITLLGLSPTLYGMSFIAIAMGFLIGNLSSKFFHHKGIAYQKMISWGLTLVLGAGFLFSVFALSGLISPHHITMSAFITVSCMFISAIGTGMTTANTLAFALDRYQDCVGTASSLFGAYYYTLVSLITFILGSIRQNNVWLMPCFFWFIGLILFCLYKWWNPEAGTLNKDDFP